MAKKEIKKDKIPGTSLQGMDALSPGGDLQAYINSVHSIGVLTREEETLMGLSENLSMLNFERNMNWQVPKKPSNEVRQAIFAFKGDVYVGLNSETLSKSDIKYAQKNLAILLNNL